jgi:putative ABC transport system permease protein
MFLHYLLVALRNLIRQGLYSAITIAGLAVALACVVFIALFVRDELSYDKWLPGTGDLYRLELTFALPGRSPQDLATVPFPMPAAMRDQIPGVTAFTRMIKYPMTITAGDRQFLETVQVVDPNFFHIIRLPFVSGDAAQALSQPESVVLTETTARKYFGDVDPIGKLLRVSQGEATIPLTVTGVLKDIPHNSQLSATVVFPNTSSADPTPQDDKQEWTTSNHYAWVALARGARPQTVLETLNPILDRALAGRVREGNLSEPGSQVMVGHLTPFTEVHLASSRFLLQLTPPGSWATIYGLMAIGVLLMLVACVNFMNLATARATLRAREIALRKTVGASRRQLVVQFLGEAVLAALISVAVALSMVEILLPAFDSFLRRPITFTYGGSWPLLALIVVTAVAAGLVSGSYPALILSRFRPACVLHTSGSGQTGSGRLRSLLVVMQFAVSIGLGIAVLVVFGQISYARKMDLGFRHEHIIVVRSGGLTTTGRDNFVQLLNAHPGILGTALSNDVAFTNNSSVGDARIPGQPETVYVNQLDISPDFVRLYDIPVVAGRGLSDDRGEDAFKAGVDPANEGHNVLINQAAALRFGFTPQQMVGKTIIYNNSHVQVVGVLRDFKFRGVKEPVKPTVYSYDKRGTGMLSVQVRSEGLSGTLAFIDKTWHALAPNVAAERYFLDDSYSRLYGSEEREGTLLGLFAGLAIIIACLGLFGLAAFTAGRRTREIGIRKTYGARTRDVALMLLRQFSVPVLIANLIAWPLAAHYLHSWLEGFAYRITLNPWYFIVVGAVALVIAWATVGVHALRVARANPIHALRHE